MDIVETLESNEDIGTRYPHWIYLALITIFAFVGLGLCVNLLLGYQGKAGGMFNNEWFCGEQSTLQYGCSGVFASRYGKPWGIPLPVFGAVYFGTILMWLFVFGRSSLNVLFALFLAGGVVVSVGLLVILFFVLPGQCRWCELVHLSNAGVVLTALVAFARNRQLLNFHHLHIMVTRAALVAFIVLSIVGWTSAIVYREATNYLRQAYENVRLSERYQRGLYANQTAKMIKLNPDDHILGSRSAPVKIVVYSDYQCEHCLEASKVVRMAVNNLNAEYPNNVALIVRHYPLSHRCNRHFLTDLHPYSCAAAQASEAVALVGGEEAFWAYDDLLHKNSEDLDVSPYQELAERIGLSAKSFKAALKDPRIKEKIDRDAASLDTLGYKAVPIVFINGRYVDGWKIPGFIEDLARAELKGEPAPTSQEVKKRNLETRRAGKKVQ